MYLKSNIVDKYKFKSYSTFHLCLILFGNFWVESCSPLSVSMSTSRGGWSWARIIMIVAWLSLAGCKRLDKNPILLGWEICRKLSKIKLCIMSAVFGRFLITWWSDQLFVFCIVSGVSRHKFRVPTKGTLEEFFFRLIKGSGRTLWLIAGDQDGWEKSWKSVQRFIITFLTIYFLGKIIWQIFEKMGHPNVDAGWYRLILVDENVASLRFKA